MAQLAVPPRYSEFGRYAMSNTPIQFSARWLLATVILATLTATATAGFTRGCAARDMQILMLIEDRESKSTVSAERLRDAIVTMMHARIVCHEGRVVDALAIYDSIAQSITPTRFNSANRTHRKSDKAMQ
jgi:hypothetical protein